MTCVLTISDLSVGFGKTAVLHQIELTLGPGTLATLIGPNGSGKSTLLATIAGLHPCQQGHIEVAGFDVTGQQQSARRHLGYMVAQEKLPGLLTPRQCLELFARARGLTGVPEESIHQAGQFGLRRWLDTPLSACSLGTRQKLSVLLALLATPSLIILDEPINGLDPVSALALKQHLKELTQAGRSSVLMATHDLTLVETLADQAIVLLEGRVLLDWNSARLEKERLGNGPGLEVQIARSLSGQRTQND